MRISTPIYELGTYIPLTKMITNERIANAINMGGTARERPFRIRMFARFLGGIKWIFRIKN
ncbi:hypothetical protein BU069_09190 [Staphylococcus succinus]|nr:hypothetical protein BU069_09190 [Staphylococcus succinus]